MPPRKAVTRIVLGPIVGHTDHRSSKIWIQVADNPDHYKLRVHGVGLFRFLGTEERVGLQPSLDVEFIDRAGARSR